ncbi:hypothetical protein DPMN_017923 [Dreissena polymorpha]|uniref:Uncharacterized protein n=1 Tax=Dreissena polymorpha TaxID=45954 RepID=A0A9D4NIH2_DREPO|nr:hypothetical protein DPMN_017923 [Dreissena polymorpha]
MSRIPSKCKRDTCPDCHATCDVDGDKDTTFTDTVSAQRVFEIGRVDNSGPDEQNQSNWLPIWSLEELSNLQSQDSDIAIVINLKKRFDLKPSKSVIVRISQNVRTLWSLWDSLQFKCNDVYRLDCNNERLILPQKLRS